MNVPQLQPGPLEILDVDTAVANSSSVDYFYWFIELTYTDILVCPTLCMYSASTICEKLFYRETESVGRT